MVDKLNDSLDQPLDQPPGRVEFRTLSLRCPVCNTAFNAELPSLGPPPQRDTDFRPRYPGMDPVPSLMHSCPSCRYSAFNEGFDQPREEGEEELLGEPLPGDRPPPSFPVPEEDDLADLRRWIRRGDLTQGLTQGDPFGAERYLLAARCFEYLKEDAQALADYYLRAAWCARAGPDRALERRCLQDAAAKLTHALDHAQVAEGEKVRVTYLIAELSRRAGDFGRAVDLFSQIDGLVDLDDEEGVLFAYLARRQQSLAVVKSDVNASFSLSEVELDSDE